MTACRASWGHWIDRLLKGDGRKAKQTYLWQAVEEVEAAAQSEADTPELTAPPVEFMRLAEWLQQQWRDDDPPVLRAFFNPQSSSPGEAHMNRPKPVAQ